jgi:signal transduction histidine kinase
VGFVFPLVLLCVSLGRPSSGSAADPNPDVSPHKILIVFSEGKDLPGNVLLEQSIRSELQKRGGGHDEFYTENMDASHFSDDQHYGIFRDYLRAKYAGQDLDLAILITARDYQLAERLMPEVLPSVPTVFLNNSELDPPAALVKRRVPGIIQRLDVEGTVKLVTRLSPAVRRVVVIGGKSPSDIRLLNRTAETSKQFSALRFDFWTNEPLAVISERTRQLPADSVILVSTMFEDVEGKTVYMSQAAQVLAKSASVPIYASSLGAIGSGAVGGSIIDVESLGRRLAALATVALEHHRPTGSIELGTNTTVTVDWRALQRWRIDPGNLPSRAIVRFQPPSLWREHRMLIGTTAAVLLLQGITIAALLAQRSRRRIAEAEILRQRGELAHVTRVSTMGQLASALAHEINQPLGAILRNTEAAELFLKNQNPDLDELRSILEDIRKDDQRAGQVIDRMRSLLKKRGMDAAALELNEVVSEIVTLAEPDAKTRHVHLEWHPSGGPLAVRGDKVQLQQVILNLVLNGMDAIKSTLNGHRTVEVVVQKRDGDFVEVSVRDGGGGIKADDLPRIFEPFFTTKTDGMGMGLAISKTIVEAHGGKIRARNNEISGATIEFTLPIYKA